jgi:hypothetical protein
MSTLSALSCLKSLLSTLSSRPSASPFLAEVDHVALGLTDYPTIVTRPLALNTISARLSSYTSHTALACDIRRVFTNCMLYNVAGSDYHSLASSFLERFDNCYNRILRVAGDEAQRDGAQQQHAQQHGQQQAQQHDDGGSINRGINDVSDVVLIGGVRLSDKVTLTSKIFCLPPQTIGTLLHLMSSQCPGCLSVIKRDNTSGGEDVAVEVNMDYLSDEMFDVVEDFVSKGGDKTGRKRKR